jgi:hypothetical protein
MKKLIATSPSSRVVPSQACSAGTIDAVKILADVIGEGPNPQITRLSMSEIGP